MSANWIWDEFEVHGSHRLYHGRDGELKQGGQHLYGAQTRYRYMPEDGTYHDLSKPWLFVQEVDGKWYWWDMYRMNTRIPMPHARTPEEAKATALAMRRME